MHLNTSKPLHKPALVNLQRSLRIEIGCRLVRRNIAGGNSGRHRTLVAGQPDHPDLPDRDRLIVSKGHCCVSLYSVLALSGFFPLEELASYGDDGSRLMSHVSHDVPGVEFSTGSLGHGLGVATLVEG